VKPGKATITVTTVDGGFSKTEEVTVEAPLVDHLAVYAKGALTTAETVNSGETLQLAVKAQDATSAEVFPFGAPVWTSSDNTVARVSAVGLVTIPDGVAAGKKANIRVAFAGKTKQRGDYNNRIPTMSLPLCLTMMIDRYNEEYHRQGDASATVGAADLLQAVTEAGRPADATRSRAPAHHVDMRPG
jgi:hypothetical protein